MLAPADRFLRLLRAQLVRRAPRRRPRDVGETLAMARMARASWREALRSGEVVRTETGYRWDPGRKP